YWIGIMARPIERPTRNGLSFDQPNVTAVSVVAMYGKPPAVGSERRTDVLARLCDSLQHPARALEPGQLHALRTEPRSVSKCSIQRNKSRTFDQLHDKVIGTDVMQRADIRMVQRGNRSGLPLETFSESLD